MSERWPATGAFAIALLLFILGPSPLAPDPVELGASPRVAQTAVPPDTLRTDAPVKQPLILSLPAALGDTSVARYTVLRGPALCGVAGRSLTWIPRDTAPGTYDVRLRAHRFGAQPDTLVVRITLTE